MTPPAGSDWPPEVRVRWDDCHRLIPETYADTSEPYLAHLAEQPDDLAALAELTAATNARVLAQNDRAAGGPTRRDLIFDVPYSKIINAAFSYPGNRGARFSSRQRGAWYASKSVPTALAEVGFHRGVLLAETAARDDVVVYVDFLADIHGSPFADLTGGDPRSLACLRPDSYIAGQDLAARLLAEAGAGVVYPSVRHAGGVNLACFRPPLVANVRPGGRYQLMWADGHGPISTLLPADDVGADPLHV